MKIYSINLKVILYILIIYPFFKPYFFAQFGIMTIVNDILFVLSFLIMFFLYLLTLGHTNLNKGILIIIIYYIFIFISTYLNSAVSFDYFLHVALCIGFALLLNYTLWRKNELLTFLLAVNILIYIYIVINLISMIVFPNGIPMITSSSSSPYYLFGNTNNVIKFALPGLCFTFLYDSLKYKKIRKRSWLLLILVWITLIKTFSVTSMFGLALFTLIVLNKIGKKQVFFTYIGTLIGSVVLTIYFVFFKIESSFIKYILNIFGKDITFSNRDILWENTLFSIKLSPIWGFGHQTTDVIRYYIGNSFGSHNYFLDTVFRGGIVSLILLLIILVYFSIKLSKVKGNLLTRILIGTCSAYFLMWVSEPFMYTEYLMFSIIFVLVSQVDNLLAYYFDENKSTSKAYLDYYNSQKNMHLTKGVS